MMTDLTFNASYGYLYAACFITCVLLPLAIYMWWKEFRKNG
jgi:hypothetical protein